MFFLRPLTCLFWILLCFVTFLFHLQASPSSAPSCPVTTCTPPHRLHPYPPYVVPTTSTCHLSFIPTASTYPSVTPTTSTWHPPLFDPQPPPPTFTLPSPPAHPPQPPPQTPSTNSTKLSFTSTTSPTTQPSTTLPSYQSTILIHPLPSSPLFPPPPFPFVSPFTSSCTPPPPRPGNRCSGSRTKIGLLSGWGAVQVVAAGGVSPPIHHPFPPLAMITCDCWGGMFR